MRPLLDRIVVGVIDGDRRTALRALRVSGPNGFCVVIPPDDPNAPPVVRPPSSREIARRKAKAEAAARDAAAARALASQVRRSLRPPAGKAFAVDLEGLLLFGPAGAIGAGARALRTLEPLARGGRHTAAALLEAGGWPDEDALREALAGLGGRLNAVGLRLDYRKVGWRVAKAKP